MASLGVLVALLGFSSAVSAIDGGHVMQESAAPKLNILLVMADQLRFDVLEKPKSGAQVIAPNLAELAAESLRIRHAYSSTPTCTPARAAILTGRSPWHHGMLGQSVIPLHYPVELARTLAKGGYHTACIGKNHFGWNETSDSGVDHGFQQTTIYDGVSGFSDGNFTGELDNWDRWFAKKMPGKDPIPHSPGYSRWNGWRAKPFAYDEELHPTAWVGRKAVKFIERQPMGNESGPQQQPFMLKVSFHRPHSPYDPPSRVLETVKAEDLPPQHLCKAAQGSSNASQEGGGAWCLRYRGGKEDPKGCGPQKPAAWCGKMPEDELTYTRRSYLASVRFVDEWVGHILQALKGRNLLERTWILFTADHGDMQGDMFHFRKGFPYESSAHIPMMLRWPQAWESLQKPGSVAARGTVVQPPIVAELRDVFHTLVDAAGLSGNASLVPPRGSSLPNAFEEEDGKSMLCLLTDPTGQQECKYVPNPGPWRKWLDMEHNEHFNKTVHWSGLTDGRMKYIFRAFFADEQLFNLTEDPFETEDVSQKPEYAEELKRWRARMVEQFEQEGRGDEWVKGGKLMRRDKSQKISPYYPGPPPLGDDGFEVHDFSPDDLIAV